MDVCPRIVRGLIMKWKDDAGHGVQEKLMGVANGVTLIVPFFCGIAAGMAVDAIHTVRAKLDRGSRQRS